MPRREPWASWAIGLVIGGLAGSAILTFGAPLLLVSLAVLALALVAARSLALLSGAFIGVGATWLVLLVRAQVACDLFDAAPNHGCRGFGVERFLVISSAALVVGLLVGGVARHRGARQRGT